MADECDEVIFDDTDYVVVTDQEISIVEVVTEDSIVVVSDCVGIQGIPGPPGPQGPPGPGGSDANKLQFGVEAGFTVQAFRLVVPRALDTNVRHALPDYAPHADRPLWVTLSAALPGETVQVIAIGQVENPAWNWTQDPIYLGPDGTLTQIVPSTPDAVFSTQVGYPLNPTCIYLSPQPAVMLV